MDVVRRMTRSQHRFAIGYVLLMATLFVVIQSGYGDEVESWTDWLAYPFYTLLLPAAIPVVMLWLIASALLGGYMADPRSELVGPVAIVIAVLLNAALIHQLAKGSHVRRSLGAAPAATLSSR